MFKRIVNVLEVVALAAAAVTIILLFAYTPEKPTSRATGAVVNGQEIFASNCAGCHGSSGGGGVGPALANGAVVRQFPNVDDQIALVTNGLDGMPAWGGTLSPDEIRAVVQYTREGL